MWKKFLFFIINIACLHAFVCKTKVIFMWYILSKDVEALEIIEFQFARGRDTSMKSHMMSLR